MTPPEQSARAAVTEMLEVAVFISGIIPAKLTDKINKNSVQKYGKNPRPSAPILGRTKLSRIKVM